MQIAINIPKEIYEEIKTTKSVYRTDAKILCNAIMNGTPLPKGHGRLFDERDIVDGSYEIIGNRIYELEPIIGADISGKENER